MFQKIQLITIAILLISVKTLAINTYTPKNLEFLSTANVSGSIQDSRGAIWLNSNRGFFRYNGQSAEYLNAQMGQTSLSCDALGRIYGIGSDYVISFNPASLESTIIHIEEEKNLSGAAMVTLDTCLYIGINSNLYRIEWDECTLCRTFGNDTSVRALAASQDGELLIGTSRKGLISLDGKPILSGTGSIRTISTTSDGTILIGTQNFGLYKYKNGLSENIGRGVLYDIRAAIEDNDESITIGTADGLYRLLSDGQLIREKIDGVTSCPINDVFRDQDGNIWISTYYNGILISRSNSGDFLKVDGDKEIQNIKGLAKDSGGNVYIATDGNGLWTANAKQWRFHKVPGTEGYKFQSIWYDNAASALWASDFHGHIMSINPRIGVSHIFKVGENNSPQSETILATRRYGGKLYMAGLQGVYTFDPLKEKEAAERIPGINRRVFDITVDKNGIIWAAGYGLYKIENNKAEKVKTGGPEWSDESTIADIEIDSEGRIWLAYFRRGVICIDGDNVTLFNKKECGLIDDYCFNIVPLDEGKALVSTGREISRLSADGTVLRFPTNRINRLLRLDGKAVLAAGNDGIRIIDCSKIKEGRSHDISIDKLSINGERFSGHILSPEQTGFSFEMATFDYTDIEAHSYFCRLKGFEDEWKEFDINQPVTYMNMKPGKFSFEVESRTFSGEKIASDSVNFRIKPYWWNTIQFKIILTLLVLTILGIILYFLYIKHRLTEEIDQKEKENKEKTMFFLNLSYQLRTPLNLAIGNIERFFNKYGARTAGIENIEDVYNKTKEMRNLISEYVDTSNAQAEKEGLESVMKNAKFLNAATGVVERNLFSADLSVMLLCAELNMGKTNLTKKMEEASGMTPRAFIEDIKLKHAAKMLRDGTYRVAEVADLLNFSSSKYFSQRFKIQYGTTPKEYACSSWTSSPFLKK